MERERSQKVDEGGRCWMNTVLVSKVVSWLSSVLLLGPPALVLKYAEGCAPSGTGAL